MIVVAAVNTFQNELLNSPMKYIFLTMFKNTYKALLD